MWRKRVDIALGILDISSSLDIDFHEPLHFCDIKEENFGINSNNQVKILDTDSLFFDTSMMKDLADPKCKAHDDCDFFDCRGWCDVNTHQCVAKRTNNNIQVIYLCVNLDTVVHIAHVFEFIFSDTLTSNNIPYGFQPAALWTKLYFGNKRGW
jgi:hypothetical protein